MSKLLISLLLLSNEFFNLHKYYVESISVRIINSPVTCAPEFQKFDTRFYIPLNTLNYRTSFDKHEESFYNIPQSHKS